MVIRLVLDKNNNDTIDNGSELFGNNTALKSGANAANGFAALADLDSNADGKIDKSDTAFSQLKIWKDANSNGVTDAGELISLADASIQSISTSYNSQTVTDSQGNAHSQTGSVTKTDGSTAAVDDVWFKVDTARTVDLAKITISEEIAGLPDIAGFGNVHSLHVAMALDTTGHLTDLIKQYVSTADSTLRTGLINSIIYAWAGVENIDPESRAATKIYGNVIGDARELVCLERFLGEEYLGTWCWGEKDPNPHGQAAPYLIQAYQELTTYVSLTLLAQTELKPYYDAITLSWNAPTNNIEFNIQPIVSLLKTKYETSSAEAIEDISNLYKSLKMQGATGTEIINKLSEKGNISTEGFKFYLGAMGRNIVSGDAANNTLSGTTSDDVLLGFSGNDTLNGDNGNDILDGGAGNDNLSGGYGSDTYRFGKGSCQDTINNAAYNDPNAADIISLTELNAADVTLRRSGNDLMIYVNGTNDSLRVSAYFNGDGVSDYGYAVDRIRFSDGSSLSLSKVKTAVLSATAENDTLIGYESNDTFSGLEGNDYLYGHGGNDNLDGGLGNDTLNGDTGNDVLKGSYGFDSLNGGDGDDLLYGQDGSDTLNGDNGNDILDGGAGNDNLSGGYGSDTYRFGKGSGQDTINNAAYNDPNAVDIISLTELNAADVTLRRSGNDLMIYVNSTNDSLRVSAYFNGDGVSDYGYAVDRIRFSDGSSLSLSKVKTAVLSATAENDTLIGYESNDTFSGLEGNDYLYGHGGNDNLDGGLGNDTLNGDTGNDVLKGSYGFDSLNGGDGDDLLYGQDGSDTLNGDNGNDILDGGAGNDNLSGGYGSDTYRFGKGSGQDTINNAAYNDPNAVDIISLTELNAADVTLRRSGNDLMIYVNGTNDSLRVSAYFNGDGISDYGYAVDRIRFSDGNKYSFADVVAHIDLSADIPGQIISGTNIADKLIGSAGGDTLYGGDGNDFLDGGCGNDTLNGGNGNDTYLFGKGSGQDTIYYAYDSAAGKVDTIKLAGLNAADISLSRSGNDLLLLVNDSNDSMRVVNHFSNDATGGYQIDKIVFADGTSWNQAVIKSTVLVPTSADDVLFGYATSDTIIAMQGDDTIYGNDGNDVADGGSGYDKLYGGNGDDQLKGGTQDDQLNGDAGNDKLYGQDSQDSLYGGDGNDFLDGGCGNDTLNGGNGNDTYLFGKGSGQDTIYYAYDSAAGKVDTIKLAGLNAADISLFRSGNDLLLLVNDSNDSMRVVNHFSNDATGGYQIDKIVFADGTSWNQAVIKSTVLVPTSADDVLFGYATSDTIIAMQGDDTIYGNDGNDVADGGSGYDKLYGGNGDDQLKGGSQDDLLNGDAGNDKLYGQDSQDSLYGGDGNDFLDGGSGNDTLNGGNGNDTYLFGKGSGQDTIYYAYDSAAGKVDTIKLAGLNAADISLSRSGNDLLLLVNDSNDSMRVVNHFSNDATGGYQIDKIVFADGTIWNQAVIKSTVLVPTSADDVLFGYATSDTIIAMQGDDTIYGNDGNDVADGGSGYDKLYGGNGDDQLKGGSQDDLLNGDAGNDKLYGQDSQDSLYGGDGNDFLDGGSGNDTLNGGNGNDTYLFGKGSGQDVISDYDPTSGNLDVLKLQDLSSNQLWFTQTGNSLNITVIGTSDNVTISNWYSGNAYHIEQFKSADGKTLLDSQVASLVSAMASLTPPAAGQTTLSQNYQEQLSTVFAANWK